MAIITTRTAKGSALTFAELDANFTNLNNSKYEANSAAILSSIANTSKSVNSTSSITTITISTQNTYLTGATAGASLAITLPASNTAGLDGQVYTIMSTVARPIVTWISAGASFIGAPAALVANNPVSFQFHLATNQWFPC